MFYNSSNGPKLQKAFFAFSGNFIIRFYRNEFFQDCSGHYSMKCHVLEKVWLLVMDQKPIDQLDCMIFPSVVSL